MRVAAEKIQPRLLRLITKCTKMQIRTYKIDFFSMERNPWQEFRLGEEEREQGPGREKRTEGKVRERERDERGG